MFMPPQVLFANSSGWNTCAGFGGCLRGLEHKHVFCSEGLFPENLQMYGILFRGNMYIYSLYMGGLGLAQGGSRWLENDIFRECSFLKKDAVSENVVSQSLGELCVGALYACLDVLGGSPQASGLPYCLARFVLLIASVRSGADSVGIVRLP